MLRELERPRNLRATWFYGKRPRQVTHQAINVISRKHCGCGNITFLGHQKVIKRTHDFLGRSPLWQVTTLSSLMAIGTELVEKNYFSLSWDLKRPHDLRATWLYGKKPLKLNHQASMSGSQRHCGSGDIVFLVSHVKWSWRGHVTFWVGVPHF